MNCTASIAPLPTGDAEAEAHFLLSMLQISVFEKGKSTFFLLKIARYHRAVWKIFQFSAELHWTDTGASAEIRFIFMFEISYIRHKDFLLLLRPSGSGYPPWILKRARLESSGRFASS